MKSKKSIMGLSNLDIEDVLDILPTSLTYAFVSLPCFGFSFKRT